MKWLWWTWMGLLSLGLVTLGGHTAYAQPASSAYVQAYELPAPARNTVVEAPGRIWFTMPERNAIGSLVVSDTVPFTEYPVPTAGSEPYDLAYANGALWFTERLGNRIGRLDVATGEIQEFPIPGADSGPTGIAVAANGDVWVCLSAGNGVARLTPESGQIQIYTYYTVSKVFLTLVAQPDQEPPEAAPVPGVEATFTSGFEDLALYERGPEDLSLWMTVPQLNQVVEFRLRSGQTVFTPVKTGSLLGTFYRPVGIVVDPTGVPWVTVNGSNAILRYAPGTLSLWRPYRLPTPDSGPGQLVFRPNEATWEFWFVEINSQKVGQLQVRPDGDPIRISEQSLPTGLGQPWGVGADENGHVWVTGNTGPAVAEWRPPYFEFSYLPFVFQ
jgi:virginiamycin B lyase